VGDVKIDPLYDTIVSADFVIPQSYVRYTKKIGDEEDPTIDYCLEEDDRVSSLDFLSLVSCSESLVDCSCGLNNIQSLVQRQLP
jgi:hypothetical protein